MRNVWMIVSGLAVVVAIGGAVYYFFLQQPAETAATPSNVPQLPSTNSRVLVVPAGNPLLTADAGQFGRWVPFYPIRCGEIVFEKVDAKSTKFNFCVGEIQRRIARYTGTSISREDVLNANVRVHWHEVTGAK